jgi:phosphoribosylformylglycinamidine synthase|tara:strand:+ start:163 stop:378 length:216 start_codon:yes stop_codon:yes gene_type:complete
MKYRIITTLKKGILDNAGKATTRALSTLGFTDVEDVRIGKTFELECDSSDIESIAQSMTNAVMEEYIIEEI